MRSFDLEKQMSVLLYGLEDNDDGYLTYHCQKDHSTILVSGANGNGKYSKGYVGVIDMRSSHNKLAHRFNGKSLKLCGAITKTSLINQMAFISF